MDINKVLLKGKAINTRSMISTYVQYMLDANGSTPDKVSIKHISLQELKRACKTDGDLYFRGVPIVGVG